MLKHTKKLLAIMLAMAVVAMSMFTGLAVSATSTGTVDLLEFGDYLLEAGSTSKYYDTVLADNGETGDSWENAIIIDNAEEFVYLAKASGNDTIGKYYKVADGIKGFDLSNGKLDYNASLADNLNTIKSGGKNHAGVAPGFQGHFDGNGVTVYGAWTNHTEGNVSSFVGLFSCTAGNVTIKNVNVKFASFTAQNAAGGIVGYYKGEGDYTNNTTLTIENCSVTDSHFEVSGTGWGCGVGAIVGRVDCPASYIDEKDENGNGKTDDRVYVNNKINIKNCYVNLDETYFISKAEDGVEDKDERACHGGVAGMMSTNALSVKDCVVIGIKPYSTSESTAFNDVQHSGLESHYANIYTTSNVAIEGVNLGGTGALGIRNFTGKVFSLSDDQLKGAAALDALNLDWSVWMADDEGYPELRSMHKDIAFVDKGDGTHGETCACGFGGVASTHIWEDGKCACGAELNCVGRDTIYWDGTIATGIATGSGTKDDPYVIKEAAEFAWLISQKSDVTADKYYEIAENIGAIVLQDKEFAEDIMALKNADEVAAFFENEDYVFTQWPNVGWEASSFCGNFDGNGATVYGLYQVSSNNAGLFSTVDAGAVIKNIALKNSYLTSTAGNYQVGGLAAVTSGGTYGRATNGAIWFDSCVVANNYMYNSSTSHDRTGVIIGSSSDMTYVENCLVYGNNATYGDGVQAAIWSSGQNSQIVTGNEIIPDGLVTKNDGATTDPRYYNVVRNSVILGAKPYDLAQTIGSRFNDPKCYEHVYTDADIANDVFSNGATLNVSEDQLKKVSLGELATLALGDKWYNTATYPELKVFHDDNLAITPNNDGTHGSVCSCGTVFKSPCTFVDGACSVCGAKMTCATKRTIYWNGGVATGFATGSGTKDDPYIINSADELAYLVSSKADVTAGKYFEIAEDIGTIVLQSQDFAAEITALDSAAAVQAYFENEEYVFTEWIEKSWEQACFAGNLEGNGVKIYGLYIVSDSNAGLFSTIDAGAAVHNVAVLNSYFYSLSSTANYQVGAIAAVTSNTGYGADAAGVVWLDGCVVGNCYMRNDAADLNRSGVLFGAASSDSVVIDNCMVYGNDARHSATAGDHSVAMPIINITNNAIPFPAVAPEDLDAKTQTIEDTGVVYYYNAIRNTISFGTDLMNKTANRSHRRNDPATYENCYTDAAAGTVAFADGEWTYEESQIKSVTLETLNDNDLGAAWIKTDSYPQLAAAHIAEVTDNGDGTHAVSCPCGAVSGEAEEHTFVDGACSVCGAECAHVAGEAVEENRKEATCKAEGSYDEVVYCTVCNVEMSRDTKVIKKADHTPSEEVEENRVDSTCTTPGSCDKVVYCTVCDEEISRNTVALDLDPDKHTYDSADDADCNECGAVRELYVLGDANGDGEVDNKDYAVLMQNINGWDVEIDEAAADVYKDGKIDNKDYAILMQYLNGWDVTLGEQA